MFDIVSGLHDSIAESREHALWARWVNSKAWLQNSFSHSFNISLIDEKRYLKMKDFQKGEFSATVSIFTTDTTSFGTKHFQISILCHKMKIYI